MLEIITLNPYRLLGVYSNSSTKERVANQGKMKAYLKVGKPVSFPLDLSNLLQPVNRTIENVADADAKLTLPADQVKYAQFWWMKVTNIDNIAFNHLLKGNVEMAQSVWEKKEDASSLQNRIVLALIQEDYSAAIEYAETLYESHTSSFVSEIMDSGISIDKKALMHNFLDILMESGLDMQELQTYMNDAEWRAYVGEKTIVPLIDSITQAIDIAKSSRGKGPNARYNAGRKLMTSTKDTFKQLKAIVSTTDIRYTTIADKLGNEILQCGIDYYNDSDDDDCAERAMKLQKYALSIVVGSLAKQRCQKNVDILKKIIAELPPVEVRAEYQKIMAELNKYDKLPDKIIAAVSLLNNMKPHLHSIKTKLGSTNPQYLKLSTLIVSAALHNVIEEVNAKQNVVSLHFYRDCDLYSLRETLRAAWLAILLMDEFDMESEFRTNRYNGNRATLKQICQSAGVSTPVRWSEVETPLKLICQNAGVSTPRSTSNNDDMEWGCIWTLITLISVIILIIIISKISD